MNVFKVVRLGLWSLLLAGCITIGLTYLAISNTVLRREGLDTVVTESHLADTVRSDVLLPKILQTVRGSEYAALLDDQTVTAAFNAAVPADELTKRLAPATTATEQWLNSKSPSIDFLIDLSGLSDAFSSQLEQKTSAKLAGRPACTLRSTLADAEAGVCRSTLISKETLATKIATVIARDASLKENTTLTPESVGLASLTKGEASDVPTYLNLLYALSLVAGGAGVLVVLWLLAKHRFGGIVAIGSAAIIAAAGLFVISTAAATKLGTLTDDAYLGSVLRSAIEHFQMTAQSYALLLLAGGVGGCLLGAIGLGIMARRRASTPRVSLPNATNTDD